MKDVTVDPPTECEKIPEEAIVGVRYKAYLENGDVLEDLDDLKVIFKPRGIVYGLYILMKEMCVGHSYQTKIPPHHGYGEKGVEGYIPSSAMLYIDLEIKEWWPQMDSHLVAECNPEVTFSDCDEVSQALNLYLTMISDFGRKSLRGRILSLLGQLPRTR